MHGDDDEDRIPDELLLKYTKADSLCQDDYQVDRNGFSGSTLVYLFTDHLSKATGISAPWLPARDEQFWWALLMPCRDSSMR